MHQRGKITLLLFFFSVCAVASLLHYYRNARPEQLKPAELFDVVHQQLLACRANQFSSAYSQASTAFQQRLSLAQFSRMIQTDYARMLKAEHVEFGTVRRHGRHALVQVYFVNRDGTVYPCIYTLVIEADGWKIDGARWVKGLSAGRRMTGIRT